MTIERYRNTKVIKTDNPHTGECVAVFLHGNQIFFNMLSTDNVWISTCGHTTATTIKRLNECFEEYDIPLRVYRKKRVAYVNTKHDTHIIHPNGMWIELGEKVNG